MKIQLNIPYSDDHENNRLDVFLPEQTPAPGCLFCIHGGGWSAGNRQQWHSVAEHFCGLGYAAISAGYRLAGDAPWPAQIQDLRLAMAFTRSHADTYGFPPDRVAVMGSSAGGHLAALIATISADDDLGACPELEPRDTRPNAAIPYCPVTTLCSGPLQNGKLDDAYMHLFGKTETEVPDLYRAASPMGRVTGQEPPFLFIHGDADDLVPLDHSREMSRRLCAAGVRSSVAVLPGVGHGFGYGVQSQAQKEAICLMADFLADCFSACHP